MSDIVHAVVGVTQIVIDIGTLALFQQLLVDLGGLLILFLLIGAIGLCLGDSSIRGEW